MSFTIDFSYPGILTISGPAPEGTQRTVTYPLGDGQHGAWLAMFRAAATDFGGALPRSHQLWEPEIGPEAVEPLITTNLDPRILHGYGDPAVIRVADGWRLFATSNDASDAFPILRSADLVRWETSGFVFPRGQAPRWAITGENLADFWAPELHRVGDGYWLVFVARNHDRELCIGLARADRPDGPFVPDPAPLLTGGMIDPHLFVRDNGEILLFWKADSNAVWPRLLASLLGEQPDLVGTLFATEEERRTAAMVAALWTHTRRASPMEQFFSLQPLIEIVVAHYADLHDRLRDHPAIAAAMRTPIFAQTLAPDGKTLIGDRHIVLINDLGWEGHLIEGGWVTQQAGRFYLFYSGNDFSTPDYGIGVAIADDPLGPYTKMPEPLLRTSRDWWGPGHPSVAPDRDGTPRLFFHAFPAGTGGYKQFRALLSARMEFLPDHVLLQAASGRST